MVLFDEVMAEPVDVVCRNTGLDFLIKSQETLCKQLAALPDTVNLIIPLKLDHLDISFLLMLSSMPLMNL